MNIADTILSQMGGNMFIAMTGAHNFVNTGDGIMFAFKGSRKANKVVILYNEGADTYTMSFFRIGRAPLFKVTHIERFEDVYCDMLCELFTDLTGLETRLHISGLKMAGISGH